MEENNVPQQQPAFSFTELSQLQAPPRVKNSGPGVASFIIVFANILLTIVFLIAFFAAIIPIMPDQDINTLTDTEIEILGEDMLEEIQHNPILYLGWMIPVLALAGTILGIIGVIQKNRKKVFSIIGLVMNGFGFLLMMFFYVAGFLVS